MNARDWSFLTDPDYGNPLADIRDWMLRPYSDKDREKHREADNSGDITDMMEEK